MREIIVRIFQKKDNEWVVLKTGKLTIIRKDTIEINDYTSPKCILQIKDYLFRSSEDTIVILEGEEKEYAISFENMEIRDQFMGFVTSSENFDCMSDINQYNILTVFHKKRLIDEIIEQKIIEREVQSRNKKLILKFLELQDFRIYKEMSKYVNELYILFHEKSFITTTNTTSSRLQVLKEIFNGLIEEKSINNIEELTNQEKTNELTELNYDSLTYEELVKKLNIGVKLSHKAMIQIPLFYWLFKMKNINQNVLFYENLFLSISLNIKPFLEFLKSNSILHLMIEDLNVAIFNFNQNSFICFQAQQDKYIPSTENEEIIYYITNILYLLLNCAPDIKDNVFRVLPNLRDIRHPTIYRFMIYLLDTMDFRGREYFINAKWISLIKNILTNYDECLIDREMELFIIKILTSILKINNKIINKHFINLKEFKNKLIKRTEILNNKGCILSALKELINNID
ncbi:hypothetical protein TCON_0884 [Astathelohania contejeani]|uniref:Uncharacterized protein n=1 Tax=Astathelohania contejeani TaxID=164912 RepID=A0ABQ7I0G7_9MICR|nr:hypothetical protein TCON_0884 [Thelohania contejeani]